jgi:hypothetical protein
VHVHGFPGLESFDLYELSRDVIRGEDIGLRGGTQLLWKKPANILDSEIDAYINDLHPQAVRLRVPLSSTSFLDAATDALYHTSFHFQKAKALISTITPEMLWNPVFNSEEV